jgi:hypothetical protein
MEVRSGSFGPSIEVVVWPVDEVKYTRSGGDATTIATADAELTITAVGQTDVSDLLDLLDISGPAHPAAGSAQPATATALLRELADLRDAGVITMEEFDAKKRDLLARM